MTDSPTKGMNLGARIAHVGGRVSDEGRVEFGSVMAVDALILHAMRDTRYTEVVDIPPGDALDAITVIFRDFGEQRGEVIVTCYGQAWTAWFGSMPEETIRAFFINAPEGYMTTKLAAVQFRLLKSEEKRQDEYLARIERRVRKFLKGEAA